MVVHFLSVINYQQVDLKIECMLVGLNWSRGGVRNMADTFIIYEGQSDTYSFRARKARPWFLNKSSR